MGRLEKLTLYSLILLLIWGNMVSGLGHGLACPDWPLCFGQFFPDINFPIFMEHGHRVMGLIVSILFFFLAKDRIKKYIGRQKLLPIITSLLLIIQIVSLFYQLSIRHQSQEKLSNYICNFLYLSFLRNLLLFFFQ